MSLKSRGQIAYNAEEVEPSAVVIVPGARVWPNGSPSVPLRQRLDAAKELYEAGKVDHILVSGDNRRSHYDETSVMGRYLVDVGIDPRDVTLDYAGFDTWDTCLRAAEQFGVAEAIFVTQNRYASRSASLCEAAEIDVQVYALDSVAESSQIRLKATVRERLASVKAVGDSIRKPDAHHGGSFIGLIGSQAEAETNFGYVY